ncbi:hypothetical protein DYL59_07650 [Pseudomonas kairouanensis]|uniref:DUF1090 domain-containing protein n=1 Tax=Pseudomonas kairouanensis TaxID=2293832 RepID=A0A4Z0AXE1_9PSED|nr:hypothetical protein [Pseudomonas kairouanensis]TFY90849.1 hypothetical protein DYL59_07650 [Pseudomonas kairouanensis]
MKTLINLAIATALFCALPAWACTPEEATQKREQLAEKVKSVTDEVKAKEINEELRKMDMDTTAADLPDKCQLIDQRMKDLDEAAAKAKS